MYMEAANQVRLSPLQEAGKPPVPNWKSIGIAGKNVRTLNKRELVMAQN